MQQAEQRNNCMQTHLTHCSNPTAAAQATHPGCCCNLNCCCSCYGCWPLLRLLLLLYGLLLYGGAGLCLPWQPLRCGACNTGGE